jgi:hypothetical protein
VPEFGTTFEADRLHWDRYELGGELIVRCDLAGAHTEQGALSWATFNFTSSTTRHTLAKRLRPEPLRRKFRGRSGREFCQQVLTAERTGELAPSPMCPEPPADDFLHLHARRTCEDRPSMAFGDGDPQSRHCAVSDWQTLAASPFGFFDWN